MANFLFLLLLLLLFFFYFLKFYFIFKLYITVLDLPNIKMNPPQVYMCSPSMQASLLYSFAFWLPNTNSLPVSLCFAQSPGHPNCCFSKIVFFFFFFRKVGPVQLSPLYLKQILIFIVLMDIAIIPSGIFSTNHGTEVLLLTCFHYTSYYWFGQILPLLLTCLSIVNCKILLWYIL